MTIESSHADGFDFDALRAGIASTKVQFDAARAKLGVERINGNEPPSFFRDLAALNPPLILRNVFGLEESIDSLFQTESVLNVLTSYPERGSKEEAIATAVRKAISPTLRTFFDADATTELTDPHTGVLVELNCTRSQGREIEDKRFFVDADHFGHAYTDFRAVGLRLDLHSSTTRFNLTREHHQKMPRNGAKIIAVPMYPIPAELAEHYGPSPREILKARQARQLSIGNTGLKPTVEVISGEYNMVRALGIVVNVTDANPDGYLGEEDVVEIRIESFRRQQEES